MRIHTFEDLPVAPLGTGIQKHMLVGSGVVPNVMQFVRACFQPNQIAPAHAHPDMTELFYIESGEGTLVVEGGSHPLWPGVSFIVSPGEKHEITSSPASELVVVYVSVHS